MDRMKEGGLNIILRDLREFSDRAEPLDSENAQFDKMSSSERAKFYKQNKSVSITLRDGQLWIVPLIPGRNNSTIGYAEQAVKIPIEQTNVQEFYEKLMGQYETLP